MQLDENYEILEFTQHEGVVVWKARDKKTGKLIQIHLFPNEKIPEASQICARLLSLPGEARSKVLKYGRDGSSTYFITEPLPEGEGLGEWVLREAAPRAAVLLPEVSSGAVGNLRRMEIEPAPLRPLPPSPEGRRAPVEQAPSPNPPPPGAHPEPRVRPMLPAKGPPEPAAPGPGELTLLYTREEVQTPRQSSPAEQTAPSSPASYPPSTPSVGFTQIYGAQDLKIPEPTGFADTALEAEGAKSEVGPGLGTFIGIPKPAPPPPVPPRGAPPERAESPTPAPSETRPVFPEPSAERIPPPTRITRQTFTFPVPSPQPPVREPAEL